MRHCRIRQNKNQFTCFPQALRNGNPLCCSGAMGIYYTNFTVNTHFIIRLHAIRLSYIRLRGIVLRIRVILLPNPKTNLLTAFWIHRLKINYYFHYFWCYFILTCNRSKRLCAPAFVTKDYVPAGRFKTIYVSYSLVAKTIGKCKKLF